MSTHAGDRLILEPFECNFPSLRVRPETGKRRCVLKTPMCFKIGEMKSSLPL